ncbi:hypothetical protein [Saccharothrix deserti]|uniref:hypothetical protein n=1 Tax=Saccharothrix deserti TaxID=2593674 RepID=UPI00131B9DDD|nr:hypothetical protein [Saccharothrix deserti]
MPVHLKVVVVEGEEESGDRIEQHVLDNPELFQADVIVVADTGDYQLGKPTFTTSLRGVVDVEVRVSTLERPVHSGAFGGPVPDASVALIRMLARLQVGGDEAGREADRHGKASSRSRCPQAVRGDEGTAPLQPALHPAGGGRVRRRTPQATSTRPIPDSRSRRPGRPRSPRCRRAWSIPTPT